MMPSAFFRSLAVIGAAWRVVRRLCRDNRGTPAIEFAIAAPVLLLIIVGGLKFGIAMQQHIGLTNAASQAATVFAFSRGNATPYTRTTTAITNAAPSLRASSLTTTLKVGGAACASDAACKALLVQGASAQVEITYPCDLAVLGVNYFARCTLTGKSTQMVQ